MSCLLGPHLHRLQIAASSVGGQVPSQPRISHRSGAQSRMQRQLSQGRGSTTEFELSCHDFRTSARGFSSPPPPMGVHSRPCRRAHVSPVPMVQDSHVTGITAGPRTMTNIEWCRLSRRASREVPPFPSHCDPRPVAFLFSFTRATASPDSHPRVATSPHCALFGGTSFHPTFRACTSTTHLNRIAPHEVGFARPREPRTVLSGETRRERLFSSSPSENPLLLFAINC